METINTFEKSISRLKEIVEMIENEETTLELAMALYKEGRGISDACSKILTQCEAEIMLLEKESDNAFALSAFPEA